MRYNVYVIISVTHIPGPSKMSTRSTKPTQVAGSEQPAVNSSRDSTGPSNSCSGLQAPVNRLTRSKTSSPPRVSAHFLFSRLHVSIDELIWINRILSPVYFDDSRRDLVLILESHFMFDFLFQSTKGLRDVTRQVANSPSKQPPAPASLKPPNGPSSTTEKPARSALGLPRRVPASQGGDKLSLSRSSPRGRRRNRMTTDTETTEEAPDACKHQWNFLPKIDFLP